MTFDCIDSAYWEDAIETARKHFLESLSDGRLKIFRFFWEVLLFGRLAGIDSYCTAETLRI